MRLSKSQRLAVSAMLTFASASELQGKGKSKTPEPSPIDRMIRDAQSRTPQTSNTPAVGSLYSPGSAFADPYRDLRASRVDDIVTIVVADRASAISRGTTAAQRKSTAKGGIASVAGRKIGPLGDLASMSGSSELQSQGSTGRESTLNTTLTARVTHVLPNGTLVVEGDKEVAVNSERQVVHVRGVVRVFDLATNNSVGSDRIANLEIRVNGKGVVGDAIRRPNILYRILTGILPF